MLVSCGRYRSSIARSCGTIRLDSSWLSCCNSVNCPVHRDVVVTGQWQSRPGRSSCLWRHRRLRGTVQLLDVIRQRSTSWRTAVSGSSQLLTCLKLLIKYRKKEKKEDFRINQRLVLGAQSTLRWFIGETKRGLKPTRMRGKAQPDGCPAPPNYRNAVPILFATTARTKVHVQRRFSVNILFFCSEKISAIGQYKVAKLRTRIVQFAPYGLSRWSKFWGPEVQISDPKMFLGERLEAVGSSNV